MITGRHVDSIAILPLILLPSTGEVVVSKLHIATLAIAASMSLAAPAQAQSLMAPEHFANVVDELRFGVGYHMVYYTMLPPATPQELYLDRLEDISFDVLFTTPSIDVFYWLGSPRPEIGTTLNLKGEDSLLHAGLTWTVPLFDTPFYVEGTFGAATHNGYLGNEAPAGRRKYGCRVNFYERFGIGVNVSDNVTATIAYEHMSNAGLCEFNAGISNLGLKMGWKF